MYKKIDKIYGIHTDYPVAELLSCLGFFLLFFCEEIIIIMIPGMAHGHSHGVGGHGHSHQESLPLNAEAAENGSCCMTTGMPMASVPGVIPSIVPTEKTSKISESPQRDILNNIDDTDVPMIPPHDTSSDAEVAGHCQKHCPLTVHNTRRPAGSGRTSPECGAPVHTEFKTLAFAEPERCEVDCEKFDEDPPIRMKSSPHAHSHGVRSATLILALSIHSVVEGVALGVGDNSSETIALFLSLMVHKLIVAFSVGLQLARTHAHQYRWVVVSMVTLAMMTPVGALIGMAVQNVGEQSLTKEIVLTILQGLAVGTFLYVTFFEVLLHERDNEHPNLLKLLVMMLGFGLIGLLRLADNHDHSHGVPLIVNGTLVDAHAGHAHS